MPRITHVVDLQAAFESAREFHTLNTRYQWCVKTRRIWLRVYSCLFFSAAVTLFAEYYDVFCVFAVISLCTAGLYFRVSRILRKTECRLMLMQLQGDWHE